MHDDRERFVGILLTCEPRCLSGRIILRITRRAEGAFTSGIALPWFG
jgi:hypothetical protein